MTRYLSIWLRDLPTGGRRGAPDGRPAVAIAKIRNAQRLTSANAAARRLGLAAGMTLAEARAMHPSLLVMEEDQARQAAALEAVLAWTRRFTPLAAPDGPDALMLDVSGVAHLFGGETGLRQEVERRLDAQGLAVATAIAATPEAAWALARFAPGTIAAADLDEKALVRLLSPLPLAALRIEAETIAALAQAGLRSIADILHRPRAPITARYGPLPFARLDALLGRAKSAISPVFEAPPYLAERRFAEGIARREDVEAVILSLAGELGGMLERHAEGARRLEVTLFRVDGAVKRLEAGTSRPVRDARAMARLFRERIEAAGEQGLETGYGFDLVRLAALSVEPMTAEQHRLAAAREQARAEDIADLVDRLGARLGLGRVQRLEMRESHLPEQATAIVPAAGLGRNRPSGSPGHSLLLPSAALPARTEAPALPARPLRLFERPEPIETVAAVPDGPPLRFRWRRLMHEVVAIEGPERIAPEWWRGAQALTRDYFRVEDRDGRRFWLFREGLYGIEAPAPRWYVHGLFG